MLYFRGGYGWRDPANPQHLARVRGPVRVRGQQQRAARQNQERARGRAV